MQSNNYSEFIPGVYVVNNEDDKWGIGQVQSCIANKATVNFEHVGKKVINLDNVNLKIIKI